MNNVNFHVQSLNFHGKANTFHRLSINFHGMYLKSRVFSKTSTFKSPVYTMTLLTPIEQ